MTSQRIARREGNVIYLNPKPKPVYQPEQSGVDEVLLRRIMRQKVLEYAEAGKVRSAIGEDQETLVGRIRAENAAEEEAENA